MSTPLCLRLHVHECMCTCVCVCFLAHVKCLSAFGRMHAHGRSAICLTNWVQVFMLLSIVSHGFFCTLRSYHRLLRYRFSQQDSWYIMRGTPLRFSNCGRPCMCLGAGGAFRVWGRGEMHCCGNTNLKM